MLVSFLGLPRVRQPRKSGAYENALKKLGRIRRRAISKPKVVVSGIFSIVHMIPMNICN